MNKYPFAVQLLVVLLLIILIVFILIVAKNFLVPLCLAILLSYLLYPLAQYLEKIGIPRIPTNVICILLTYGLIGVMIYFFSQLVANFVADLPNIQEQAQKNIVSVEESIEIAFGFYSPEQGWLLERINGLISFSGEFLTSVFTATTTTLATIGLLPIYIFLLLYYREKFYMFLTKVFPEKYYKLLEKATFEIKDIAKSYMGGIFIVVMILVVLNSAGLMIIGLEHAIFLGVLSAVMNFIPYIGTIIGAAIPLTYAIVATDSLNYVLGVIILFVIIQFLENNILTPNITGSKVNINPLITIMTVIAGGMIWGIAGMFIFLPFVAMLKVIFNNIDPLRPYAFLLGTEGTEKHAITFNKIKSLVTFGRYGKKE